MCLQQISALYFSSCMKMCCDVRGSSKNMRMYVSSVMYLVNCIQQPTKSISLVLTCHSGLQIKKKCSKELLHKCDRGNEIEPLQKNCRGRFKTLRLIVQRVTTKYVLKK